MISALKAVELLCYVSNNSVTNLQVHRLLYIANMIYLGDYNKRLINEDFEAWEYGPVLSIVYQRFKHFGVGRICPEYDVSQDIDKFKPEVELLQNIWDSFRHRSGTSLIAFTHQDFGAWKKVYQAGLNKIIPDDLIIEEYSEMVANKLIWEEE
tara:strand:- start:50 stop:508 length:459 start_codon:yes stop_codon:yes gene_type:complete